MSTDTVTVVQQLEPYIKQFISIFTFTNGLLIFLIVYILIRDISRYIKSFINGGMV